jgi:DNA-binding MltR family transcriptional regulator
LAFDPLHSWLDFSGLINAAVNRNDLRLFIGLRRRLKHAGKNYQATDDGFIQLSLFPLVMKRISCSPGENKV